MTYYFSKSSLIFVNEVSRTFVFDENTNEMRLDSTEQNFNGEYWFQKGKLLDYVTTGHNRFENDTIDPERVLMKEAEEYRRKLKMARN